MTEMGFRADPTTLPADPDPLWQGIARPHRALLGVLGMVVAVETNSRSAAEWLAARFGRFEVPVRQAADFQLTVLVGGPQAADGAPIQAPFFRESDGLFAAGDGRGSVAVAALDAGRAVAFLAGGINPGAVGPALIESPLWRFAGTRGLVAIHAAALAIRGVTFVLRGLGGAGKSTLAYAGVCAGHTLVAEEVTWWDPRTSPACLRGTSRTIRLERDALWMFPELGPQHDESIDSSAAKLSVDMSAIPGTTLAEVAPVGPVVFVEIASGDRGTTLRPLSNEGAMARFEQTSILGERTLHAAGRRAAYQDLIGHGAWALTVGRHAPRDAIAALESLAVELGAPARLLSEIRM